MAPGGLSLAYLTSLADGVRPWLAAVVFAGAAAACPPRAGIVPEPGGRAAVAPSPEDVAAPLSDARRSISRASGAPGDARGDVFATAAQAASSGRASAAAHDTTLSGLRHTVAAAERSGSSRFFLSGDGVIDLESAHTGEKLRVRFRDERGRYDATAIERIDALFRSRGDGRHRRVALRLVELIDYLQDRERPASLVLLSGYRSGEYNAAVIARGGQASRASMHTEGLAADLHFVGLDHRALWLKVRGLECCGAGYYASGSFLHVDVGRARFWEEGTSRVKENLSKGNARVIARTDFDRYDVLDGAEIGLHAVTLRPLRIARTAELVADGSGLPPQPLRLERASRGAGADDTSCLEFAPPPDGAEEEPIALRVVEARPGSAASAPGARGAMSDARGASVSSPPPAPVRARVVVHTCEPRLEATPERIETNPLEIRAAVPG